MWPLPWNDAGRETHARRDGVPSRQRRSCSSPLSVRSVLNSQFQSQNNAGPTAALRCAPSPDATPLRFLPPWGNESSGLGYLLAGITGLAGSSTDSDRGWGDSSGSESGGVNLPAPGKWRSWLYTPPPTAGDDWGDINNPHAQGAVLGSVVEAQAALAAFAALNSG
jgi:hypothetical protein